MIRNMKYMAENKNIFTIGYYVIDVIEYFKMT